MADLDPLVIAGLLAFGLSTAALIAFAMVRMHYRGHRTLTAVLGLTLFHQVSLVVFPLLYGFANDFAFEARVNLEPERLLRVYLGEALFVAVFVGILILKESSRGEPVAKEPIAGVSQDVAMFLIGSGLWLQVSTLLSPHYTVDDILRHADLRDYATWRAVFLDWFGAFVRWPSSAMGALVLADSARPRWLRLAAGGLLLLIVLNSLANGYRGGVMWVACLLLAAAYLKRRRHAAAIAVTVVVLTAPLFSWLKTDMVYIHLFAPEGESRLALLGYVREEMAKTVAGVRQPSEQTFWESSAMRAEGPRNSVGLYDLHDAASGAGPAPIWGSLLMPIPRFVWRGKPVGGSVDGTNEGAAIYQVQRLKPNTSPVEMGPLLASAHAYWEGGYLWLCAAGMLTALFWLYLTTFRSKYFHSDLHSTLVLCFLAALPIDGLFTALNPLYTLILIFWKSMVPMWLLIVTISFVRSQGPAVIGRQDTSPRQPAMPQRYVRRPLRSFH